MATVESLLHILFQIEAIEGALRRGEPRGGGAGSGSGVASDARGVEPASPGSDRRVESEGDLDPQRAQITLLLAELPRPIRDQLEWLRTWTAYPIARLRNRACTGCGGSYPNDHPFVVSNETRVTYCEHCLRILLLRDLALVA